jgi:diguanylate cyclase (GGDEF)-like protein
MRQERLTYKDLARKLLAGRLLRREERSVAESVLRVDDTAEMALRLGELLEEVAERGGLIRLAPRSGNSPATRRYLDPGTNDHWTIELPRPRPVADDPAPSAPEAPASTGPIEEPVVVPAVPERFQDEAGGLDALFTSFSPSRTLEDIGNALHPIRAQLLERTTATDVRFHFLLDPSGDLVAVPFRGRAPEEFEPLGERVREAVLGDRRILHVANLGAPGTGARDAAAGALASLPLVSSERATGLMEVVRDVPGPFDPEELQFFAMAARIAAGLVERAEVLEKLIFLDKLTGLYNRAYFDEQIEREIERANRQGTSVALVMADLDHFKKINDGWGHQAGDHALAHTGSIIHANVRSIDVAARYGGEEFAVLLPSTTLSRAELTAERLRRVVSEARLGELVPELTEVRLSISLGIALYPDDASTAKQLIDRADRVALYAAKNWGRNRVVTWAEARDANERLKPGT